MFNTHVISKIYPKKNVSVIEKINKQKLKLKKKKDIGLVGLILNYIMRVF